MSRAEPGAAGKLAGNLIVFDRDQDDPAEWQQYWKRVELYRQKARVDESPYLVLGN